MKKVFLGLLGVLTLILTMSCMSALKPLKADNYKAYQEKNTEYAYFYGSYKYISEAPRKPWVMAINLVGPGKDENIVFDRNNREDYFLFAFKPGQGKWKLRRLVFANYDLSKYAGQIIFNKEFEVTPGKIYYLGQATLEKKEGSEQMILCQESKSGGMLWALAANGHYKKNAKGWTCEFTNLEAKDKARLDKLYPAFKDTEIINLSIQ